MAYRENVGEVVVRLWDLADLCRDPPLYVPGWQQPPGGLRIGSISPWHGFSVAL
jgi:hypothetical protein